MRPGWEKYFIFLALMVARRSTCLRRKVGAIIVKDNRILATGYNGVPRGIKHCNETGCLREILNVPSGERHELCRGLHAEQNAIIQAATYGVSISDAQIFSTDLPCIICLKMLINANIKKIYYLREYKDPISNEMLKDANIELIKLDLNDKDLEEINNFLDEFRIKT